ncbi:MAG: hypothetical protein PHV18_13715 [Lachnospiraceae bacterium]|nr:hypothetical protein [Lachnospiraceae bacterium]
MNYMTESHSELEVLYEQVFRKRLEVIISRGMLTEKFPVRMLSDGEKGCQQFDSDFSKDTIYYDNAFA